MSNKHGHVRRLISTSVQLYSPQTAVCHITVVSDDIPDISLLDLEIDRVDRANVKSSQSIISTRSRFLAVVFEYLSPNEKPTDDERADPLLYWKNSKLSSHASLARTYLTAMREHILN